MVRAGQRRPGQTAQRKKRSDQLHRVLVFSEGSLTEPVYFGRLDQYFKQLQGRSRVQLIVRPHPKTSKHNSSPEAVVQRCIELVEEDRAKHKKGGDVEPYSRAYAVVDVDQWDQGAPSPLRKALALASSHDLVDLVISNPQFELWLLLHCDPNPPATSREIVRRCDEHGLLIGKKGKGLSTDFPVDEVERVVREADSRYRGKLNQKLAAPSTAVIPMIEELLNLLEEPVR